MFTPFSHQASFSSLELSSLSKSKTSQFLEQVNACIDWRRIEEMVKPMYCMDNGRPSIAPIILVKGLLLEQWYQLSDEALEEELKDRLSFRNFVGLASSQQAPDETTMVKFRNKLREHNLEETLFTVITRLLREQHREIKQGKVLLTDASIIESPYGKEPKGRDGNGDFVNYKGKEIVKGYKAHLVTNQRDGLAESAILTVASCHESGFVERAIEKVQGPVNAILADKGYASDERKRAYRKQGIYCGILEKGRRNQLLSEKQQRKNKRLSKIRSAVERVFAVIKVHFGFSKVRYFGLRRNAGHLAIVLMAYNIQHAVLNPMT